MPANGIMFSIATGSDGVRGDSGVLAQIFGDDGAELQSFQLKVSSGPAFGDPNTINTTIWALDPQLAMPEETSGKRIAYIQLTLQQHGSFPESIDHWDIEGISVSLCDGHLKFINDAITIGVVSGGVVIVQSIATQGTVFGVSSASPLARLGDKASLAFSGKAGDTNIF